ncbi:MAG: chemotaxis protein CheB, partial [Alicyclobacillus shizuokensis]|nr:chemotaxis protein CheB [Alicyclobacillus shizuokensis]
PAALARLLPEFPSGFAAPIVVCQHMTTGFTAPLAQHLDRLCPLPVSEAVHGEPVQPGRIYLAPAGWQTRICEDRGAVCFQIEDGGAYLYRPCIDITLTSLAALYRQDLLAIILTGMGRDGTDGCRAVHKYRGYVMVEAPETCAVYGMPRSVYQEGLADVQLPLHALWPHIEERQRALRMVSRVDGSAVQHPEETGRKPS